MRIESQKSREGNCPLKNIPDSIVVDSQLPTQHAKSSNTLSCSSLFQSSLHTVPDNQKIWYAVQTFYNKELRLGEIFAERGFSYFIPMCYKESTSEGNSVPKLAPAIHNLLFLEKTDSEPAMLEKLKDIALPFRLFRNRETNRVCEIPDRAMIELRAACDQKYSGNLYMEAHQAEARPGRPVRVIRGPFAGLEGKLTQYKKRYYVVVTIATLGVLLHIPRWYCEKI
jgi:transcription antitermination factor NusG